MLSVSEARYRIVNAVSTVGEELVPLSQATQRVLVRDVLAQTDLPAFTNSSMDGFAVRAADLVDASPIQPVTLMVLGDIPAGASAAYDIHSGQTVRIMTGAPIPQGADAVVPIENTNAMAQDVGVPLPEQVDFYHPAAVGEYIRPQGQDVKKGQVILSRQRRLKPVDIGVLAMNGLDCVPVYRLPRVAIFSSGDELLPIGAPLVPGKIYDTNGHVLTALVEECGAEAIYLGIAADRLEAVVAVLNQAVDRNADLILSSAGVSVGAFDYVKTAIEQDGRLDFWRVNMRPGKPLVYGEYREIPIVGLPGNPVSAYIGYEVFVRPAILKMSGVEDIDSVKINVMLSESIQSDGRESFLRAYVSQEDGRWVARLTGHQGSGNLMSLVRANALLIIPSGVKSLPIGAKVEAWITDAFYPGRLPVPFTFFGLTQLE
jgi:molybdopterin molybdotransferase